MIYNEVPVMLLVFVEEFESDRIVLTGFPLDAKHISFPEISRNLIIRYVRLEKKCYGSID